ncbi:MAG: hypothetical protein M3Z33_03445 [Actinomycetota bacterium]|nr:hypothetical protein [Actinomycetota bacterium]
MRDAPGPLALANAPAAPANPPSGGSLNPRAEVALPLLAFALGAATVLAGLAIRAGGGEIGATLPPFWATWAPRAGPYTIPALALVAAGLAAAQRLRNPAVSPRTFAAATTVLALGLRLALAAARSGPGDWSAVFGHAHEATQEYLPALPALHIGSGAFLSRFAEISPTLPSHPSAHPPGLLLALRGLDITTAAGMAALTIAIGALSAPLVYALGRQLADEARARTAALLYLFAPISLLYGATSADALFATLALAATVALLATRRVLRGLGPLLLAVASFFSYALIAVAAWAVLVRAWRGEMRRALAIAASSAAGLVAFYVALRLATGFDLLAALDSAETAYRASVARVRPYPYWLVGSPTAFFIALGLPLAWLVMRAAARRDAAALALLTVIAVAALSGYTKAETERIWLFLAPFACLAAANALPARRTAPVLVALALQAIAIELLVFTVW